MNGSEPKIEIFKPFGEAFELMKKILFQPFDVKKWFVVGFAAWLANLGGGGFNYQYNRREATRGDQPSSAFDSSGRHLRSDRIGSRSHCSICLAARARPLHVYRLHRQEPRGGCRTLA